MAKIDSTYTKMEKYEFYKSEEKYLGHKVGSDKL